MKWVKGAEGIAAAGHAGENFAFDCEGPCHEVLLAPHALASRPVSNGEWQEFIADGGSHTPALWLSDGWAWVQAEATAAPAYWHGDPYFTLPHWHDIDPAAPGTPTHFSENDAFPTSARPRLPTPSEWG